MVETLAELPFIGDQVVCLSHDQAARSGPAGFHAGLMAIMKTGNAAPFRQRYDMIAPVIGQTFDLEVILRQVIGPRLAALPPDQRAAVGDAFRRYTIASYVANFDTYSVQRFEVAPVVRAAGSDRVVETHIAAASGQGYALDYVMRQESGGWKVVDVLVDGAISRVAAQRSEMRSMLADSGGAGLARRPATENR